MFNAHSERVSLLLSFKSVGTINIRDVISRDRLWVYIASEYKTGRGGGVMVEVSVGGELALAF